MNFLNENTIGREWTIHRRISHLVLFYLSISSRLISWYLFTVNTDNRRAVRFEWKKKQQEVDRFRRRSRWKKSETFSFRQEKCIDADCCTTTILKRRSCFRFETISMFARVENVINMSIIHRWYLNKIFEVLVRLVSIEQRLFTTKNLIVRVFVKIDGFEMNRRFCRLKIERNTFFWIVTRTNDDGGGRSSNKSFRFELITNRFKECRENLFD